MTPTPTLGERIAAILKDPAVIVGLVRATIILLITFGVSITQAQQDAVLQTVGALLAVVSLVLTGVTYNLTIPKPDQT